MLMLILQQERSGLWLAILFARAAGQAAKPLCQDSRMGDPWLETLLPHCIALHKEAVPGLRFLSGRHQHLPGKAVFSGGL